MERIDELKIKLFENSRKITDIQREQKLLYDELIKIEKEAKDEKAD